MQRGCYACDEVGHKFFVNDTENPYTTPDDAPFKWFRGRQVGGRSITWGRQVYRWSDLDFTANAKDGHGNDWPIRYKDIAPWYSYVEKFIGVTGAHEGLVAASRRRVPPADADDVSSKQDARPKILKAFGGERVMTIGRAAILTQNHNGRLACHYCGPCERGCVTHSYFNSIGSTLPAARKTGNLTLRPNSVVAEVLYDPKKRPRARRARDRREHDAGDGVHGAGRVPLRVDDRVGAAAAQLEERALPRRPRELERHARPLRDGSSLRLGRVGHDARASPTRRRSAAGRTASTSRASAT